jgi:hypothetical protein
MNTAPASFKMKYFVNPDSVREIGGFEIIIMDKNSNIIS